jgi:hypothetical protein
MHVWRLVLASEGEGNVGGEVSKIVERFIEKSFVHLFEFQRKTIHLEV